MTITPRTKISVSKKVNQGLNILCAVIDIKKSSLLEKLSSLSPSKQKKLLEIISEE